jgi:signal transduction histidine kinase
MTSSLARNPRTHLRELLGEAAVHVALASCVVATYVLTVTLAGLVVPQRASFAVSLLAAGLVAILVQPLRARLRSGVDRLLYGQRDDPYAVVSQLGERLQATVAPRAALTAVVETVASALRLPFAAIELTSGNRIIASASVGEPVDDLERLPLVHGGETVGALLLAPRSRLESLGPADRRLVEVLARQVAVAAHAARLTTDLQASRERLVIAREEERRRLCRDLHDGLGPFLAAMTLRLDAAANLVPRDPAAADRLLAALVDDVRQVRFDIRRLIDDLRPPPLDDLGLLGAIRDGVARVAGAANADGGHGPGGSEAPERATGPEPPTGTGRPADTGGSAGLVVSLDLPGSLPDLPAAVEVTAYWIALEAVTNVVRHAAARACQVRLVLTQEPDRALVLIVEDDGCGLPPDLRAGVGLVSMRERASELGGRCAIEPGPAGGTRVQAWLPLPMTQEVAWSRSGS